MHPSEIMLTNMNDFLTKESTNLFPIVMASTTGTYMYYIGNGLLAFGLFPEICWLAYPLGGAFILLFLLLDYLYGWKSFASLADSWLYILGAFLLWLFLIFMAIFGEIILIPWFLVSIFPLGTGYLL